MISIAFYCSMVLLLQEPWQQEQLSPLELAPNIPPFSWLIWSSFNFVTASLLNCNPFI